MVEQRIRNKECKENRESESEDDIRSENQIRLGAHDWTKIKCHNRANSAPFWRFICPGRYLPEEQNSLASEVSYTQSMSQIFSRPKLSQWRSEPTFTVLKNDSTWQAPQLKLPSEEEDRDLFPPFAFSMDSSDSSTTKCSSVRNMWLESPSLSVIGYRSSANTVSGDTIWLDGGSQPVTPCSYARNRRSSSLSKIKLPLPNSGVEDRRSKKAQCEIDSKQRSRLRVHSKTSSNIKKYDIMKKTVGKGSSAKVKKATNLATKEIVAVKIINKTPRMRKNKRLIEGTETSSTWDNVLQEISIMKMLRSHPHQNIVQLYEVMETKDKIHIVMEYLEGGPVMAGKTTVEPFKDMERIRRYLRDLLMGLEYLHALGVVHMDIKPENLLLDKNDRLKIIDFGAAKHVKDGGMIRKFQGTPAFTPPETITEGPFRPWPLDIWAVGITLYTFSHGSPPFNKEGISRVNLYKVIQKEEPKFNLALDPDYISCIDSCLIKNPDERTTLRGLRTNPWVTKHGKDPLRHQEFPEVKCFSDDCKIYRHESKSSLGRKSRGRRIRKALSERDVLRGSSTSYES